MQLVHRMLGEDPRQLVERARGGGPASLPAEPGHGADELVLDARGRAERAVEVPSSEASPTRSARRLTPERAEEAPPSPES